MASLWRRWETFSRSPWRSYHTDRWAIWSIIILQCVQFGTWVGDVLHCSVNLSSKQFRGVWVDTSLCKHIQLSMQLYLDAIICHPAVRASRHSSKTTSYTHTHTHTHTDTNIFPAICIIGIFVSFTHWAYQMFDLVHAPLNFRCRFLFTFVQSDTVRGNDTNHHHPAAFLRLLALVELDMLSLSWQRCSRKRWRGH